MSSKRMLAVVNSKSSTFERINFKEVQKEMRNVERAIKKEIDRSKRC